MLKNFEKSCNFFVAFRKQKSKNIKHDTHKGTQEKQNKLQAF